MALLFPRYLNDPELRALYWSQRDVITKNEGVCCIFWAGVEFCDGPTPKKCLYVCVNVKYVEGSVPKRHGQFVLIMKKEAHQSCSMWQVVMDNCMDPCVPKTWFVPAVGLPF